MEAWVVVLFLQSGIKVKLPDATYATEAECKIYATHTGKQYDLLSQINPAHPDRLVGAYCEPVFINRTRHRT